MSYTMIEAGCNGTVDLSWECPECSQPVILGFVDDDYREMAGSMRTWARLIEEHGRECEMRQIQREMIDALPQVKFVNAVQAALEEYMATQQK